MRVIRRVYSSLAQSVEHLTVNQGVAGSSPAGGAKKESRPIGLLFFFLFPLLNSSPRTLRIAPRCYRGENFVRNSCYERCHRQLEVCRIVRVQQTNRSAFFFIQSEGLVCNYRAKCGVWNSSLCDGMASRNSVYLPSD